MTAKSISSAPRNRHARALVLSLPFALLPSVHAATLAYPGASLRAGLAATSTPAARLQPSTQNLARNRVRPPHYPADAIGTLAYPGTRICAWPMAGGATRFKRDLIACRVNAAPRTTRLL